MTDTPWLDVVADVAYRSGSPLMEVMEWPLMAVLEFAERDLPISRRFEQS